MAAMRRMAMAVLAAIVLAAAPGCSVKRYAVNRLGDSLAASGTTYTGDDDPDLVGQALPFGLKLIESLLAESPRHQGLLVAATSGFTSYAHGYVEFDADVQESVSLDTTRALRARARRLYLRARDYGLRALEARHPGFGRTLAADPVAAAVAAPPPNVAPPWCRLARLCPLVPPWLAPMRAMRLGSMSGRDFRAARAPIASAARKVGLPALSRSVRTRRSRPHRPNQQSPPRETPNKTKRPAME